MFQVFLKSAVGTVGGVCNATNRISNRLTYLHGFVSGLEVESGHLRADVPDGHRVVVGGVDALRARVHPAQLRTVVPAEGDSRSDDIPGALTCLKGLPRPLA